MRRLATLLLAAGLLTTCSDYDPRPGLGQDASPGSMDGMPPEIGSGEAGVPAASGLLRPTKLPRPPLGPGLPDELKPPRL